MREKVGLKPQKPCRYYTSFECGKGVRDQRQNKDVLSFGTLIPILPQPR